MSNAKIIWDYLKSKGLNNYGTAGLMGNLDAESSLNPKNLENYYNKKFGITDEEYTKRVDNGTYTNFVCDSAGYGLAQWTFWSRKQNLLNFAKQQGKSIGDLNMQLDFLMKELSQSYPSVLNTLKNNSSVQEASNAVLLKFECPADQSVSVQNTRASYGQKYYNQFVNNNNNNNGGNNMGHNTYTKGQKTQLSSHFVSTEFDCHGSGCCSTTIIDPDLISYLEKIREHFGKPITITSGYRCATHNRNVGGAIGSRHSKGDAADIVVSGIAPAEVAKYAESIGVKGIGLYETSADGFFTHIDTRPTKSFWYGQGQAYRATFGGGSSNNNTAPVVKNYVGLNDVGEEVKTIQLMLLKLGYTLTNSPTDKTKGADGIFGQLTKEAVIDFQKKNGLTADGMVGEQTLSKLVFATNNSNNKEEKKVEITANVLNIRKGPGTSNPIVGVLRKGHKVIITEAKDGWGKCDKGWISLEYVKEV